MHRDRMGCFHHPNANPLERYGRAKGLRYSRPRENERIEDLSYKVY